jgi:hypothetical protein
MNRKEYVKCTACNGIHRKCGVVDSAEIGLLRTNMDFPMNYVHILMNIRMRLVCELGAVSGERGAGSGEKESGEQGLS